jgi:hypothetical protein
MFTRFMQLTLFVVADLAAETTSVPASSDRA